ncbi:uracil-DNA glycosylase [Bordetella genomosp. 1]|uniref:Uracil-DNA glycosylase n=1 Tax=Bordetella genomosp. 1 TaxID=1395607 RepID=A0A261RSS1_9BORD|nr:uracil-DNA glycosylase [Bordetella genomosp. 1]OZI28079.1 uracil-DNA glycosylase [Bordetella genomosp. 1]
MPQTLPSPHDNRLQPGALSQQLAALPAAWRETLQSDAVAPALARVTGHVEQRLAEGAVVYPATPWRALAELAPHEVRVVILGQDPYHGPGQAQGLAFSVPDDCKCPPSLRNIFKEILREQPDAGPLGHDLGSWVRQGVLLLNTSLTVEDGQAGSHAKRGWETVTDAIFARVAQDTEPKAFLLWGAHAQAKAALLPAGHRHLVLQSNHPSPLSASRPPVPFLGCGHFSQVNAWLATQGKTLIDWSSTRKKNPAQREFAL